MAWRPHEYLIEGILDNTISGKVVGVMKFAGLNKLVKFDLNGNFHRDIRGSVIRLKGEFPEDINVTEAKAYMKGFSVKQNGDAGDITCGLPPQDYVEYPYIEWYSKENGRCVLELGANQIEILSPPIPAIESDPISRKTQADLIMNFMQDMAKGISQAINKEKTK